MTRYSRKTATSRDGMLSIERSAVVRSDDKPIPRWSVQLLRADYQFGVERPVRSSVQLFVSVGPVRFQIGSR